MWCQKTKGTNEANVAEFYIHGFLQKIGALIAPGYLPLLCGPDGSCWGAAPWGGQHVLYSYSPYDSNWDPGLERGLLEPASLCLVVFIVVKVHFSTSSILSMVDREEPSQAGLGTSRTGRGGMCVTCG